MAVEKEGERGEGPGGGAGRLFSVLGQSFLEAQTLVTEDVEVNHRQ